MNTPDKNNTDKAGERHRDEQREEHAAYEGQNWKAADSESVPVRDVDKDVKDADEAVESGGQHAGMGRGEAPRKPKSETK